MTVSLLLRWVLNAVALFGIAYGADRLNILEGFGFDAVETAFVAAAVLGLFNLTVRPILKLLTLPITCLTFGLFALIINAVMMLLTGAVVRGFEVGGFLNALLASILFAIASGILNGLFNKKEDE